MLFFSSSMLPIDSLSAMVIEIGIYIRRAELKSKSLVDMSELRFKSNLYV
jgi:hypothetical protein